MSVAEAPDLRPKATPAGAEKDRIAPATARVSAHNAATTLATDKKCRLDHFRKHCNGLRVCKQLLRNRLVRCFHNRAEYFSGLDGLRGCLSYSFLVIVA